MRCLRAVGLQSQFCALSHLLRSRRSFPTKLRPRRRLHIMTTDSGPVSSIDEIKERCGPIFRSAGFRHITWAGVFGSFSRGKQSPASDVDLLVGFRDGTTGDDVYYMPDLEGPLRAAMQRDVDVLYLRAMQPLDFIRSQALLTAKTVYEVGTWLPGNRSRAEKLLVDAYDRFKVSLGLMGEISKRLATMTEEVSRFPPAFNYLLLTIWHLGSR